MMEGEFSSESMEMVMETIPSGQLGDMVDQDGLKNPIPCLVFKKKEGLVVESEDVVIVTGLNKALMLQNTYNDEVFADEDEEDCPTIGLSKREKVQLQNMKGKENEPDAVGLGDDDETILVQGGKLPSREKRLVVQITEKEVLNEGASTCNQVTLKEK
ncbi:hypothetical protein PTKIN_Ptkin09bG0148800 [Pterospermum kingtungense]